MAPIIVPSPVKSQPLSLSLTVYGRHSVRGSTGSSRAQIGEALDVGVDIVVCLAYFERLLIDLVWRAWASAPLHSVGLWRAVAGTTAAKAAGIRTDDGLGIFGARGA